MGRKPKVIFDEKLKAVEDYLLGKRSISQICLDLRIDHSTFEERVEIVAFCTENDYDYDIASKRFDVSYQQAYTWVKKYKEHGYEGLIDKRGKRKEADKMSDSEKLAAQLKLLESENRRLKMENDFLKKLEELKRRR